MTRKLPRLPLFALAALMASTTAATAQDPGLNRPPPKPVSHAQAAISESRVPLCANQKLVQELVTILNETDSPDTFLVTVKALSDVGSRSRVAVPAIIRNAERLQLLQDILEQEDDETEEEPGLLVVQAIERIITGVRGDADSPAGPDRATTPAAMPMLPPAGLPQLLSCGSACSVPILEPSPFTPLVERRMPRAAE